MSPPTQLTTFLLLFSVKLATLGTSQAEIPRGKTPTKTASYTLDVAISMHSGAENLLP